MMPEAKKILGQSAPSATTLTSLYAVPTGTFTVTSTLMICNRGGAATTIRVAIIPDGETIASEHYIYYGVSVPANDTLACTIGMTLAPRDAVWCYATLATVSFSLFGVELT